MNNPDAAADIVANNPGAAADIVVNNPDDAADIVANYPDAAADIAANNPDAAADNAAAASAAVYDDVVLLIVEMDIASTAASIAVDYLGARDLTAADKDVILFGPFSSVVPRKPWLNVDLLRLSR